MAFNKDITIEQGTTFSMLVTVQDSQGYALDLTGYTAAAQVRENYADDATIQCEFATSIDTSTATITCTLTASQTRDIAFVYGRYDVEVTDPVGAVTRVVEGRIRMSKEVTRVS